MPRSCVVVSTIDTRLLHGGECFIPLRPDNLKSNKGFFVGRENTHIVFPRFTGVGIPALDTMTIEVFFGDVGGATIGLVTGHRLSQAVKVYSRSFHQVRSRMRLRGARIHANPSMVSIRLSRWWSIFYLVRGSSFSPYFWGGLKPNCNMAFSSMSASIACSFSVIVVRRLSACSACPCMACVASATFFSASTFCNIACA